MGSTPHKKLGELGKEYGDIFSVHYGQYPYVYHLIYLEGQSPREITPPGNCLYRIVVLNSLPVIREAFRQDVFSGRPNHLLAMKLSMDGK